MKDCILIINGGWEAIPGIEIAKKKGLYVVGSDLNPNAPGFQYCDASIIASTYDPVKTLEQAQLFSKKNRKINGVISIAADVPMTVAHVCNEMGLVGISSETAELATDKLLMKNKFKKDGIRIPWYQEIRSPTDLRKTIQQNDQKFVLKPIDSRGSRGVLQIDKNTDPYWAFETAIQFSKRNSLLCEEYLEGPQVSTESLVIDGVTYTLGFSDRNYEFLCTYKPYFIENGGQLPSKLPKTDQQKIKEIVQKASRSLGVINGVVKGDIVWNKEGPAVIEMAARLSGGYFCTNEIPLNTGVDFVGAAIDIALGKNIEPESLIPKYSRPVVQRYFFPKPGLVKNIEGLEEAIKSPGVEFLKLTVDRGDIIFPPTDSNKSAGVVITTGDTQTEALENALLAISKVRFSIIN